MDDDEWRLDDLHALVDDDLLQGILMQGAGTSTEQHETCWGGALQHDASCCTPGFSPRLGHFKNKLCDVCKERGIVVAASRVRALDDQRTPALDNAHSSGVWSITADNAFRVINNSSKCVGPKLVVFRDDVPDSDTSYSTVPSEWLEYSQHNPPIASVRLVYATGTLRPAVTTNAAKQKRAKAAVVGESGSAGADTGPSDGNLPTKRARRESPIAPEGASAVARDLMAKVAFDDGDGYDVPKADVLQLLAAISDERFKQAQREEMRVCAAALPSLDEAGQRIIHGMFCTSTVRTLTSAGATDERKLGHILAADWASSASRWCRDGAPRPKSPWELDEQQQMELALFCLGLLDVSTWVQLVQIASSAPMAASPTQDEAEKLAKVMMAMNLNNEVLELDSTWKGFLQPGLECARRELEHKGWERVEVEDGVHCQVRVSHTGAVLFVYEAELADVKADHALTSDPAALSTEALEVLHKVNEDLGFVLRRASAPEEPSYTQYVGCRRSSGKRLMALADYVMVQWFGVHQVSRLKEVRCKDGAKIIELEWDQTNNRPIRYGVESINEFCISSLRFDASTQRWIASGTCVSTKLPASWVVSNARLISPMKLMMHSVMASALKVMTKSYREHLSAHCASRFMS